MKFSLFALFLFFTINCSSASNEGVDSLETRMNSLVVKKNQNSITAEEKKELMYFIFKIQNSAFHLGEQLEYEKSIIELDKATNYWVAINDTLSIANLKKFKAIMLAKLGRFGEAENEGRLAIELFGIKGYNPGVAVSQHDLAIAFDLEQRMDSALYYELKSKSYYLTINDSSRIIGNDIHLINIYRKTGDFKLGESLQVKLVASKGLAEEYSIVLIDFYYVSYQLYEKMGVKDKSTYYLELYNKLVYEVKSKGVNAGSFFDEAL